MSQVQGVRSMVLRIASHLPPEPRHGDMADQASATGAMDTEIVLAQRVAELNKERKILANSHEFAEIIGRLCSDCRKEIPEARLRALPFTKLCIDCMEKQES